MPAITVTASRDERPTDRTSKAVSVVGRRRIEERSPRSVQEALQGVPGVSFARAGGLGGQVVVRGFNSNDPRLVLFVDGDRFRGRNTLEYMLFDPSQIERVEIVRGPVSALYGPDAMAGIVHIITRRSKGDPAGPFRLVPRLRALNYDSSSHLGGGRAELDLAGHGLDLLLGGSFRQAGEYRAPGGSISNSQFRVFSGDLRAGFSPGRQHRIELSLRRAEVESGRAGGIGAAPGAPLLRLNEEPLTESFAKLAYSFDRPDAPWKRLDTSIYARRLYTHIRTENRTQPNRLVESDNFVDGPLIIGGKAQGSFAMAGSLIVGADFFHERRQGTEVANRTTPLNPDGSPMAAATEVPRRQNAPDATQLDVGLFLHHDWDLAERLTISLGGRVDFIWTRSETSPLPAPELLEAYERGQTYNELPLTGGVGFVYRPLDVLHLTANVGRAFRAPATFESFGSSRQGAGFLVPNPELRSETGVTYELGTRLRFQRLQMDLVGFHSDYRNLITTTPVTFQGTASTQRQNIGRARIQGAELQVNWLLVGGLQAFTSATWLRGTDRTTDRPLPYLAPLAGETGLRHSWEGRGFVESTGRWSLTKRRIDEQRERQSKGYVVLDLRAGVNLWALWTDSGLPDMRLSVGLENLFNRRYRHATTVEDIRFPRSGTNPLVEPGRSISISLASRY